MSAIESINASVNKMSFAKGRECNDNKIVFLPLVCNYEYVCIVVLTNKVIYANGISHVH